MKQKTILLTAFIICMLIACQAQSPKLGKQKVPDSVEKQIDLIFKEYDKPDSAGVAIAIMQKGNVVFLKGYGSSNLEHRIPIYPKITRFNIGSTSKQFTAFSILLLAEQKKLSLDDNIRKHIPELHNFGKKITLRQMIYHTSGIRSELQLLGMAGYTPGDVITRNTVLQMIYRQKELDFESSEKSSYSNSGFTLLSEVVERVSGKTFAEFTAENIFKPLQMDDSFFIESHQSVVKNMADPYGYFQNEFYKSPANEGYSGPTGLLTTASDLTKWALNFRQPTVGNKKIIEQMNTLGVLNNGETFGFAMGQFIEKYKGLKHIQHGGGTAGYVSYLGRFPEQDFAVLLLGNSSSINARGKSLEVADVFLAKYFKDKSANGNSTKNKVNLANFKPVGHYWNEKDQRSVQVSVNNNSLLFAIGGGPTITLIPSGKGEFQMQNVGIDRRVRFNKNAHGDNTMHVFVGGKEVETFEIYTPQKYTTEELKQYVGKYYSEELGTIYALEVSNGSLIVRHLRFANNTLVPVKSDIFRNTSWRFSTLKFERNKTGKIIEFRISSMRVKNVHFKKM